ncbi:MAG: GntR family transcriptional regulator [Clostridiaceae bacterium]|nr:GntR family transcriptional regulator [Clostridiaceae bacterium]
MKQSQTLYEYLYQMLTTQFFNGTFQYGRRFLSQREICRQYNVGITTARKVMKMLDEQGYIRTIQGKPAIITYHVSAKVHTQFLAQRRDEIADAYKGLGLLMPILYREGAKRCGETELKFFRELADSISDQMELDDLHRLARSFFAALLYPMNNQLIMDLELDSENFLQTPYIPVSGLDPSLKLTADQLKNWMQNAIFLIENKHFHEFYTEIGYHYQSSAKKVDGYLSALGQHTPMQTPKRLDVHWFHIKGRSELYTWLAMTIIRRIVSGEFDGQKYLPSISKLMEEYGVMKETASKAVSLLNTLGFAKTLDKKGTVITIEGCSANDSHINLSEPMVQERLSLFLNALEILALTAHNCAASIPSVPESMAPLIEKRLLTAQKNRISPLSYQLLMNSFIQLMPFHSLKNIFGQLEELIIWGHYLQTADKALYPDPRGMAAAMEEFVSALNTHDPSALADAYGNAFTQLYEDVLKVISQIPDCSGLLSAVHSDHRYL